MSEAEKTYYGYFDDPDEAEAAADQEYVNAVEEGFRSGADLFNMVEEAA